MDTSPLASTGDTIASFTAMAEPSKPNRHSVRAAEYRASAKDALAAAENSGLAHVREKFLRSAEVWTALAEADEDRALQLQTTR